MNINDYHPHLSCPLCGSSLVAMSDDLSHFHQCMKCRHLLVTHRELQKRITGRDFRLLEQGSKIAPAGVVPCPECHKPMLHLVLDSQSVHLEHCPHCGFFWIAKNAFRKLPLGKEAASHSTPETHSHG